MDDQFSPAELAELRAATHRLLGSLFQYPENELVTALSAAACELQSDAGDLRNFSFFGDLSPVVEFMAGVSGPGTQRLQQEYLELFQINTSHPLCPLHESAYVGRDAGDAGRIAAEVERAYTAAGVTISPALEGELPDHVGLELEFMSFLCDEEAEAWKGRRPQRAGDCLRRQGTFLDQHLARWLPRLARRLNGTAAEESFYRRLALAARSFVIHDTDIVAALAEADP